MTDLLDVKETLDQMLQYLNSTDVGIIGKELKQNIVNARKIVKKLTLTDVAGTLCGHKIYHKNGMVERYNNFCAKCNTHLR